MSGLIPNRAKRYSALGNPASIDRIAFTYRAAKNAPAGKATVTATCAMMIHVHIPPKRGPPLVAACRSRASSPRPVTLRAGMTPEMDGAQQRKQDRIEHGCRRTACDRERRARATALVRRARRQQTSSVRTQCFGWLDTKRTPGRHDAGKQANA